MNFSFHIFHLFHHPLVPVFCANMYRHVAEVSIGSGVFIAVVLHIENSTQIRNRFPVIWNIAKFLVWMALFFLYNKYRRPQLS